MINWKWLGRWTDEWVGEWLDRTDEWVGEWLGRTDERAGEWLGRTDEWVGEWLGRTDEWVGEWLGRTDEWVGEWVDVTWLGQMICDDLKWKETFLLRINRLPGINLKLWKSISVPLMANNFNLIPFILLIRTIIFLSETFSSNLKKN